MKRLVHISRRKILSQIVIGNIAIAISTIVIIGIIAIYTSTQHINKEFVSVNRSQMDYNVAQTENELERVVKIPFTLNSQNQNIQQLFRLAYSDDVLGISARFPEFVGLYADYGDIDSMWIYDGKRTIIDTKSGVKQVSGFDKWKELNELTGQAKRNYEYMKPYISEMRVNKDNNHKTISVITPFDLRDSSYQSGCVIINVNIASIVDSVSGVGTEKGNFFIVNSKNNEEIIIRRQDWFSKEDIGKLLSVSDSGNIHIGGEKFHVLVRESKMIPKYIYVLAVPYTSMARDMSSMYLQFILAVLCLILIELITILAISRYIYQPFKAMFENVNLFFANDAKEEEEKNKTFDELAVINEYMSNLQEKLTDKSEKLVEYSSVIRQNVGQRITDGDWEDEEQIRKSLEECGVFFEMGSKYTLCAFMIDNWFALTKFGREESVAIKNAVFAVIESVLSGEFNCISNIPQNDRVTFIIEEEGETTEKRIDKAFESINDILRLQIDKTVSMARVSGVASLYDISVRCIDLLELIDEHFSYGSRANIKKPIEKMERKDAQQYYKTFMGGLKKAISDKDISAARTATNEFAVALRNMPPEYIKALILNFANSIKDDYRAVEASDFIQNNISDIVRYSTAEGCIGEIVAIVSDIIARIPENADDSISYKIKEYIDNNLNKDLSLVSLGDVFKLTPSYLSTLFKSAHGIGVVDYVNKSRIEKAKEMLRNTNKSIKDISDEIGFMNYNSFARVFKKYVGISAKDYKYDIDTQNQENS